MPIEIISGYVNITDPCYDTDVPCPLWSQPARNGRWSVEAHKDHDFLRATHDDFSPATREDPVLGVIEVDTGTVSIVDSSVYNTQDIDKMHEGNINAPYYIPNGILFGTKYGDGSYSVYVKKDAEGQIVSIFIDLDLPVDDEEEAVDLVDELFEEITKLHKNGRFDVLERLKYIINTYNY